MDLHIHVYIYIYIYVCVCVYIYICIFQLGVYIECLFDCIRLCNFKVVAPSLS